MHLPFTFTLLEGCKVTIEHECENSCLVSVCLEGEEEGLAGGKAREEGNGAERKGGIKKWRETQRRKEEE